MFKQVKIALLVCFIFFVFYSLLSVTRHLHFGSYGFDLGIADQTIWKYSQLKLPITTIDHIPFVSELFTHLEFVYFLLVPIYWLFHNVNALLIFQAFAACFSALPIFLLAHKYGLNKFLSYVLMVSYLMFYGIQNALWFDFHSTVLGVSFLTWFIYFIDIKNFWGSIILFLLVISCKENYALMTLLLSIVYFVLRRDKRLLLFIGFSCLYLAIVFGLYFPYVGGYHFQSKEGLFGDISLLDFVNSSEKIQVLIYTFLWTGLLSMFQPLFLIPIIGNLASYFILGRDVSTAQGLFLQYRIELAPLLFLATIYGIKQMKFLNNIWTGFYLLFFALLFQYVLHLPLSYLSKSWFWKEPVSVKNINSILSSLPQGSSVVAQNNIVPHISSRDSIFVLYPTTKDFLNNSPCEKRRCNWLRWVGKPEFLIVDTSSDWDARSFLIDRENFIEGVSNIERAGVVKKYRQVGDATLYKVLKTD